LKHYTEHDPSTLTEAKVVKVCECHAVAYATAGAGDLTTEDSITFSLSDWRGVEEPQAPQVVMLYNVMLYDRGWRAREAFPVTPQPNKEC
jgi:hypothetical protein